MAEVGVGGPPVYPTAVARTPVCFRSDSDGSQKQPMPKVASRVAWRDDDIVIILVGVVIVVPLSLLFAVAVAVARVSGDDDGNGGNENATTLILVGRRHARIDRNEPVIIVASCRSADVFIVCIIIIICLWKPESE